ncbi:MAG: hypothetical protein M1814_004019 [Vezdaea aestivalis]|nr:MAG: hypothetical protein M1814_004019 [Vezdaea aestivalis]
MPGAIKLENDMNKSKISKAANPLSAERVVDSDLDSDSDSDSDPDSSDGIKPGNDDRSGVSGPDKGDTKLLKNGTTKPSETPTIQKSQTSGTEDESKENDNSEGSDGEEAAPKPKATQESVVPAGNQSQPHVTGSKFKPPPGFQVATGFTSESAQSKFLRDNQSQKIQMWQITAPANVPIGSIAALSLADIKNARSVLQHQGAYYRLEDEKTYETRQLLIQHCDDKDYGVFTKDISRTLRLQRQLVSPFGENEQSARPVYLKSKLVRQQPEDMRLRYTPFGISREEQKKEAPRRKRKRAKSVEPDGAPQEATKKRRKSAKVEEVASGPADSELSRDQQAASHSTPSPQPAAPPEMNNEQIVTNPENLDIDTEATKLSTTSPQTTKTKKKSATKEVKETTEAEETKEKKEKTKKKRVKVKKEVSEPGEGSHSVAPDIKPDTVPTEQGDSVPLDARPKKVKRKKMIMVEED